VYFASFDSEAGKMPLPAGFDRRTASGEHSHPRKAEGEAFQRSLTPLEKVEHLIKLTCEQAS
jgi:hypothetical protein